ncbi:MAG: UDP-N-acetylmuramoyl-tripeptide--D-alanyl-D-alanine ligase [Wenzhouxiangella sp.]|nr:MAG: UDP-N-acetylmuramoyl-tripeptide--D-alanyl-D-alanine ligase [Wenzhouxiangella sp.]
MTHYSLDAIATWANGRLHGASVPVHGMIHDSRRVEPGMLFVAIAGERVDGHDYLDAAAASGAAAALVSRPLDHALPQVVVDDTVLAMGRIAAGMRRQRDVTVVGITGSNGKTTVKEMITAILAAEGPTLATVGNYNNEIGVPLTLSRLTAEHRFAVIEMGAGKPGDIAYLAELAAPDVAVVTNAGPAHLERLGSVEGVARTKGALFEALGPDGVAVINADDAYADLWTAMAGHCRRLRFGLGESADIRGRSINGSVCIETPAGLIETALALPGRHNLMNALAATTVAHALGVPLERIGQALAGMHSLPGRLQMHRHPAGWCLIDDTYNANPASLYAGLQVLTGLAGEAWLVLGDMAELGPDSAKLHREMGRSAADLGVRRLFAVGPVSAGSVAAFGPGAMHFDSHEALQAMLGESLHPGVNCLVKGSRSMAMEQVVKALMGEER